MEDEKRPDLRESEYEEDNETIYLGPITPGKFVGVQERKVRRVKGTGEILEVLSEVFSVERDGVFAQGAKDAKDAQGIADSRNRIAANRKSLGEAVGKGKTPNETVAEPNPPKWTPPEPK